MTIKLNILAEDIKTSNYCSNKDCAIARAFERQYPEQCNTNWSVGGVRIQIDGDFKYQIDMDDNNILIDMYNQRREIEDFELELIKI
jgi:hypothetical protein